LYLETVNVENLYTGRANDYKNPIKTLCRQSEITVLRVMKLVKYPMVLSFSITIEYSV